MSAINVCTCLLQTALHWAAKHGRKDIIVLLGKTGMDVNVKTVRHHFFNLVGIIVMIVGQQRRS